MTMAYLQVLKKSGYLLRNKIWVLVSKTQSMVVIKSKVKLDKLDSV
jgi:hypothetical protein